MIIGVLGEKGTDRRVPLIPENVAALLKLKVEKILVEKGAGTGAFIADEAYVKAGAELTDSATVCAQADIVIKLSGPSDDTIAAMGAGKIYVGGFNPLGDHALVQKLAAGGISSFSLDVIPRTTRAQAMDILSSMATISGYKAVLVAASTLPTFFPMFMTAAGTITPSKVLIVGAGVAGLQAIATARRLGAVVEAFDVRTAAREEVLSLGAKFVDVEGATDDKAAGGYAVEQTEEYKKRQAEKVHEHAAKSDVVICTALIPGRPAPRIIHKHTVEAMKPGSVIVDLAAATGGNCELTENDKTVVHNGVSIIGNSGLAATMPADASKMLGKNMVNFLKLMIDKEGGLNLDFGDDLIEGTCVTHEKAIKNERVKSVLATPVNS